MRNTITVSLVYTQSNNAVVQHLSLYCVGSFLSVIISMQKLDQFYKEEWGQIIVFRCVKLICRLKAATGASTTNCCAGCKYIFNQLFCAS